VFKSPNTWISFVTKGLSQRRVRSHRRTCIVYMCQVSSLNKLYLYRTLTATSASSNIVDNYNNGIFNLYNFKHFIRGNVPIVIHNILTSIYYIIVMTLWIDVLCCLTGEGSHLYTCKLQLWKSLILVYWSKYIILKIIITENNYLSHDLYIYFKP